MAIKNTFLVTLLVILLGVLFSCRPYGNCHEFYEFYVPVSITAKDTFVVGDTLWIEMDVPNQLTNHQTGEEVDLSNFELILDFGISRVDSSSLVTGIGHLSLFDVVERVGRLKQQVHTVARHRLYMQSVTEKKLRLGVVPQELGTYSIGLNFSTLYEEIYEPRGLSQQNCYEHFLEHTRVLVNDGQTNFYLVENICQYDREGNRYCYKKPGNENGRYNGYYFHVKEP